jgi:hypothetical protein
MKYQIVSIVLMGAIALSSWGVQAKAPLTLKSETVRLPEPSRKMPAGPNVATVNNNCLGCHSAGMILTQPAMTRAGWEAEVNKMRNVYKAPVEEKDVPAIVDYLNAIKGAQ